MFEKENMNILEFYRGNWNPFLDMSGTISGNLKMYDVALKNMRNGIQNGYELFTKLLAGEEVEYDKFFQAIRTSYDDISTAAVDAFKSTPFNYFDEIDAALKKSFDSFEDEQKMVTEFLKELSHFNSTMSKLSVEAQNEANQAFSEAMAKGAIPVNSWKKMLDALEGSVKHSMEIFRVTEMMPHHKLFVSGAVLCSKESVDVFVSGLEIYVSIYQRIKRSADEICQVASMVSTEGKLYPEENFCKKIVDAFGKSLYTLVENRESYTSIPKHINAWTELMKSSTRMFRTLLKTHYVPKELGQ